LGGATSREVPWPTFGAGEYRVNGLGCNINGLLFPLVKWFHLGFGALGESGAFLWSNGVIWGLGRWVKVVLLLKWSGENYQRNSKALARIGLLGHKMNKYVHPNCSNYTPCWHYPFTFNAPVQSL
jgi:hypothetical protein